MTDKTAGKTFHIRLDSEGEQLMELLKERLAEKAAELGMSARASSEASVFRLGLKALAAKEGIEVKKTKKKGGA